MEQLSSMPVSMLIHDASYRWPTSGGGLRLFSAQVIRKNKRRYPEIVSSVTPRFLEEASIIVQADAKRMAPVKTGNLRGSIDRDVQGDKAVVGTNVEYAEHVEYGTRYTKEQPYLRPAIDQNRKGLIRRFAEMIRRKSGG